MSAGVQLAAAGAAAIAAVTTRRAAPLSEHSASADKAAPRSHPLRSGPILGPEAAREYRLRAIFECGKLDPQVADTPVLAPFPLLIGRSDWRRVAAAAEALSLESLAAERELLHRPDLHRRLALPSAVRRALKHRAGREPRAMADHPRVARFDFHWACDDPASEPRWQVSEVNADVPGGFIEAGVLAQHMLGLFGDRAQTLTAPPDPAETLADALARRLRGDDTRGSDPVALVHATAFADDYQVMRRLGATLESRGLRVLLAAPDHVGFVRHATPVDRRTGERLGAIVRFYPAEWLPELSGPAGLVMDSTRPARWLGFFDSPVPLTNPATALVIQSKRWPLVWDRLQIPVPTWRAMVPETRDPRRAADAADAGNWVLKPALGRVGEGVLIPGLASRDERAIRRAARRHPRRWIAQRRFLSVPIHSPLGPLHVCLGVYVIDGAAAGLYARAALRPLIDQGAYEIPVLIQEDA